MDRTQLVKLLLISALSAGLVLPLFFYSRGLLQKAEQALVATQASAANEATSVAAVTPDSDARVQPQAHSDTGHDSADTTHAQAHGSASAGPERTDHPAPTVAMAQALASTWPAATAASAAVAKEEKFSDQTGQDAGAQVYKPPLFGSCKRMFQQLQKQEVVEGEYKAFAFAFDGKTANCAEYVSNKSLRHARAVVQKNCQEDRADKRYVACLLYDVQ